MSVERSNSNSLSDRDESYSSFVQRKYNDGDNDDDADDSDCSSLTSSSGGDSDTFHVFTDASVSVDGIPLSKQKDNQVKQVLLGERQKLQTERQQLELERQKLNDERKKLEEERRRLRLGDDAYQEAEKQEEAAQMDSQIRRLSAERANLEKQDKIQRRLEGLKSREREKDRDGLEKLTDLDNSGHELAKNFRRIRRLSKDSAELKRLNEDLDKTSLHLDDLEEDTKRAQEERRKKEGEIKRKEEEQRKKILEKARMKIQEERRLRQESIRSRIAAEEAEAKRKKKEKEEEEKRKSEKTKTKANTPQARAERAYGWYSKLGLPTRDNFKKKIKLIASIDITAEDIDLLPWNGTGTMVNVAKLNSMYYNNK